MMEIRQKKFSNNILYEFKDDNLRYTLKEKGNRTTFSVNYGNIPLEFNELEERNEWFRNVGILWCAIGLLQKIIVYFQSGKISGSFWLGLGLLCLVVYKIVRTKYSIYPTDQGNICVIHDKNHDKVILEIKERRKKQLLKLYGDIDFDNIPENEIEKFKWLNSEDIISGEELKAIIEKITSLHPQESPDETTEPKIVH